MIKPIEERVERFLCLYPHEIAFPLVRDAWEEIQRLQPFEEEAKL